MSKDLIFTVEFNVKPEREDEFMEALLHVLNRMSEEDTFVSTYLQRNLINPHKIMIFERWAEPSWEVFRQNHLLTKDYRKDYEARLPEWLVEERKFAMYEPLQEWVK
ncbi:putative quinol monooxygenase [Microbulbifer hainanensis]|uniref:putative quinol monooxygenase n=1 Tax=Microbulbifer hainanensis TaxID=2735675 RepID=UPI001865BC46|nr:antibiotic biosynthesis monooxygenase family protein [Microbulbifer hainanensis]